MDLVQVPKLEAHLRYGIVMIDAATVLHGYDGYIRLMQDAGAHHITVAPLAPANDCAVHILGQRLIRARQAGVANPTSGINRLG